MDTFDGTLLVLGIFSTLITLLLLYLVIRLAVTHSLRRHEVWMRDGSLQVALDRRADDLAEVAPSVAAAQEQMRRERTPE